MSLGIFMGISHDFLLRPVHAHVNLLGFAVLAVAAFVFHAFPDLARTRLATAWFWLYNIAMPVGLAALALMLNGKEWAEPALDRKSTRLNSSHQIISYAVFCLKKTKQQPSSNIVEQ